MASAPLFRIEQLIGAILKGSPDDPVYLRVGSTTYGIQSITDGQIRVGSGKDTQDAAQVVKTLRRYATGTPKGEDTGIAWRIVGVGGGTAIKSVSHDGSRIVVTTLANEGKAAETFEAPRDRATPAKRAHNKAVSAKISQVMRDYDKTGKIGNSKPKNRAAALKQAMAVAFRSVNADYAKKGKRLPSGVRRAETFNAPMGYAPDGPRPFYGNRRKLVRDRWGNLRFIRRRKDGTYMDNVDFGRSIRADRRRQAKTWAPPGFRDQGDGSFELLTSLMGAEDDDSAWSELIVLYGDYVDSMEGVKGAGIYQRAWYVPDPDEEDVCLVCQGVSDPMCMVVYALTDDADAVMDGKAEPSEQGEYFLCDLHAPQPFQDSMAAEGTEDGDFVWVLILDSDHFEDVMGGVFTSKDEAIEVFSDYLRGIGGDPDGINWDYDAMVWGHDEEDDPSLGEHSIRLYQEKLNDPDFSKYYAAEDVYVHGDDGEARSIRVNKTHARNMSNLSEGSTTTVKDQRKGTKHTVKRVGKGFDLAAEGGKPKLPRPKKTFFGRKPVLVKVGLPCHPDSPNHPKIQKFVADYGGHLENDETFWEGVWVMLVSGNESQGTGYINNTPVNPEYLLGQLIEWDDDTEEVHIIEATTPESLGWMKGDFDAESNDSVWLVNSAFDGTWEEAQAFRNQSDARRRFDEIIDELGGDPSEVETGVVPPHHGRFDWSGDGGFRRAVMYQVTIQDSMGAEGGMKCNFCEEEMDSIAYDTWHGGYCSGYCCDMGYEQATGGSSPSSHS